jgi:hypothetical protein
MSINSFSKVGIGIMTDEEKRFERRKQTALERLGTNTPKCILCPEVDWRCLDLHHGTGGEHKNFLVILCRNCKGKLTYPQADHPRFEHRKQAAFKRLGTNTPKCVLCPEDDWRCLDLHHVAGREYGDDVVIVCRNCHARLSDAQYDHPEKIWEPPERRERDGHALLGWADIMARIVTELRRLARSGIDEVRKDVPTDDEPPSDDQK